MNRRMKKLAAGLLAGAMMLGGAAAFAEETGLTVEQLAKELSLPCFKGKTWTTDAFYRETPDKIARRKAKGAIAVEMECAALAACAAFRKKHFAHFLFAADNLDAPAWDQRGLALQGTHIRDQLLELAFEAALRMDRLF